MSLSGSLRTTFFTVLRISANPDACSASLFRPASRRPLMVSLAMMPVICPCSSTLSRAFSTEVTRAASLSLAPSISISVKASSRVLPSSGLADCAAFSTSPRTTAPAGIANCPSSMTGPITTGSTGFLALEVGVATLVFRRIWISLPMGIRSPNAGIHAASARMALALLHILERLAIDFLDPYHEPLAAIEHSHRRLESRRDHAVRRLMRPEPFAREQPRGEFRPEHRQRFEKTLGVHFANRLTQVALTLIIVHLHGYGAHLEQYVGGIGHAEIDHHDRAVLIQRRGAHLEDLARKFDPVAALHQEDAAHRQGDDREANAKRGEEVISHDQTSRTIFIISSMDLCAAVIRVPSKRWVSRPTLPS